MDAFERHYGLWTRRQQEVLGSTTVAVGGVGGVGAAEALLLAKGGIRHIRIADKDTYQIENIVEQAFATYDELGNRKVVVAANEMKRHQRGLRVKKIHGDLCESRIAQQLVRGAKLLFSGVDNPEARVSLGRAALLENIPFIVAGNVGWSVFHTIYRPDRGGYAAAFGEMRGLKKDELGFPVMSDECTRRLITREWCIWTVAFSGFRISGLRNFVRENLGHFPYAASPAYLAASLAVANSIKHVLKLGRVVSHPDVHVFDLKSGRQLSRTEMRRRYAAVSGAWTNGTRAVLQTIEELST